MIMTLDELRELLQSGEFHHATYRNIGTLWEGLHIYKKDPNGFRGFTHVGAFGKNNPDLTTAMTLTSRTGISVGSYGNG